MAEIDTYGVPEYFASHVGVIEDAGYGMVRLVHCIKRNNCNMPVCSIVMPAQSLLQLCRGAEGLATKVLMDGGISQETETATRASRPN